MPPRRAVERDEKAIGVRQQEVGCAGKTTAADLGAWICFADETGQGLKAAESTHLGPARGSADRGRARPQYRAGECGRGGLLSPRRARIYFTPYPPTGAARVRRRVSTGGSTRI
ncbi:hypothetical protein Pta02_12190 [Planobispora takensis]|uniref:Transposase n=1 Tax=Planobispora takensis TaxID=1367882 RepID=A0A8J3STE8_9ACTN|nr:hypothetical protein Pta02_12190 [Planobispora takensis]